MFITAHIPKGLLEKMVHQWLAAMFYHQLSIQEHNTVPLIAYVFLLLAIHFLGTFAYISSKIIAKSIKAKKII